MNKSTIALLFFTMLGIYLQFQLKPMVDIGTDGSVIQTIKDCTKLVSGLIATAVPSMCLLVVLATGKSE